MQPISLVSRQDLSWENSPSPNAGARTGSERCRQRCRAGWRGSDEANTTGRGAPACDHPVLQCHRAWPGSGTSSWAGGEAGEPQGWGCSERHGGLCSSPARAGHTMAGQGHAGAARGMRALGHIPNARLRVLRVLWELLCFVKPRQGRRGGQLPGCLSLPAEPACGAAPPPWAAAPARQVNQRTTMTMARGMHRPGAAQQNGQRVTPQLSVSSYRTGH